ncbi:hypothetical protein GQ600_4248 [Phytophthora cactorum]|nr:hypothetical protein GQ600_4248 [Phytophthora cactorum]
MCSTFSSGTSAASRFAYRRSLATSPFARTNENLAPACKWSRTRSTSHTTKKEEASQVTSTDTGLLSTDFVDKDERSPYHPHERIRRDFSAVLELTSYPIHHTPVNENRGRFKLQREEEKSWWSHGGYKQGASPQYEILTRAGTRCERTLSAGSDAAPDNAGEEFTMT